MKQDWIEIGGIIFCAAMFLVATGADDSRLSNGDWEMNSWPRGDTVHLELKRAKLEEAGCPHYWLVDPDIPTLRCLALRNRRYVETHSLAGEEFAELAEPYPIRLSPESLVNPYSID